ncbi:methyltransferase domain-containing protein [Belliella marina]|uniref:Methyltransferase domain-containing protein n=1 Tax=Belliella marina TaxID=1644146 RepID=A0ABW4VLI4_9BACT
MKQTICPVCNTGMEKTQKDKILVQCNSCDVTWTYIGNPVNLEELYQDEVYKVVDNRNSIFEKIIFWESEKIIEKTEMLSESKQPLKILDFGSGKGHFLYKCQQKGWDCHGIETAKDRADFSREKYGVNVSDGFYEGGLVNGGNFDVIALLHVLEHLPDPKGLLKKLLQNLKTNGILIIEVPNIDSWQSRVAGENWMHLDLPKHLSHWNGEVLALQMEQLGLVKLCRQNFSFHLGVLGMTQALLSRLGFKKNIIKELKNNKRISLLLPIMLLLPASVFLELLSLVFGKGGILRIYFKNINSQTPHI